MADSFRRGHPARTRRAARASEGGWRAAAFLSREECGRQGKKAEAAAIDGSRMRAKPGPAVEPASKQRPCRAAGTERGAARQGRRHARGWPVSGSPPSVTTPRPMLIETATSAPPADASAGPPIGWQGHGRSRRRSIDAHAREIDRPRKGGLTGQGEGLLGDHHRETATQPQSAPRARRLRRTSGLPSRPTFQIEIALE